MKTVNKRRSRLVVNPSVEFLDGFSWSSSNAVAGAKNVTYTFRYRISVASPDFIFYALANNRAIDTSAIGNPLNLSKVEVRLNGRKASIDNQGKNSYNYNTGLFIRLKNQRVAQGTLVEVTLKGINNIHKPGTYGWKWIRTAKSSGHAVEDFTSDAASIKLAVHPPLEKEPAFILNGRKECATQAFAAPEGEVYQECEADIYVRRGIRNFDQDISLAINRETFDTATIPRDAEDWTLWRKDVNLNSLVETKNEFSIKATPAIQGSQPLSFVKDWQVGLNLRLKSTPILEKINTDNFSAKRILLERSVEKFHGVNVQVISAEYDLEMVHFWGEDWTQPPTNLRAGEEKSFVMHSRDRGGIWYRAIDPETSDEKGFVTMSFTCPMLSDSAAEGSFSGGEGIPEELLMDAGLQSYETAGHPLNITYKVGEKNKACWNSGNSDNHKSNCGETRMKDVKGFVRLYNPKSYQLKLRKYYFRFQRTWLNELSHKDLPPANCHRTLFFTKDGEAGLLLEAYNESGTKTEGFLALNFDKFGAEGSPADATKALISSGLQSYEPFSSPKLFEYQLGEKNKAHYYAHNSYKKKFKWGDRTNFGKVRAVILVNNTYHENLHFLKFWNDNSHGNSNWLIKPKTNIPALGTRYFLLENNDRAGLYFARANHEFHLSFTCPKLSSNAAEGSASSGLQHYEESGTPVRFTYNIGQPNLASWDHGNFNNGNEKCPQTHVARAPEVQQELSERLRLQTESIDEEGLLSFIQLSDLDIDNIHILAVPESTSKPVDEYLQVFEDMLMKAEDQITLSTLWLTEGEKQEEILKRAIARMNRIATKDRPTQVVVLWSQEMSADNEYLLSEIEEPINPYFSLALYKFDSHAKIFAWNHSKVVAVDDDKLLVGGINFVESEYQSTESPINDVALYIEKEDVAKIGHQFISRVLNGHNDYPNNGLFIKEGKKTYFTWGNPDYETYSSFISKEIFENQAIPNDQGENYLLGVGKYNNSPDEFNMGRAAILNMINIAQEEVNVAQQSIAMPLFLQTAVKPYNWKNHFSPYQDTSEAICQAIGYALQRGVKVNIVLTGNINVEDYNHGEQTLEDLRSYILEKGGLQDGEGSELTIKHAKSRVNGEDSRGKTKLHAKVVMVDRKYVYVGSHNIYYDDHAEYGIVVKSTSFCDRFLDTFWSKIE